MTDELVVESAGLRKWFGDHEVLKGIDLQVRDGEVLCIIGPSGSGKSTLLRCINLLENYQEGRLLVLGQLVGYRYDPAKRRFWNLRDRECVAQRANVGMVFQKFNLFSHRTVLGNVIEAPTLVAKTDKAAATQEARQLLERVGLADRAQAFPHQLSSGQQQRVAIARALAMHPKIMLFDEPTSALDPELVGEVLAVIRGLVRDGMTMIVVTHEIGFAREVADSIAFMEDGKIVEQAAPAALFSDAAQPRTRAFLEAVL